MTQLIFDVSANVNVTRRDGLYDFVNMRYIPELIESETAQEPDTRKYNLFLIGWYDSRKQNLFLIRWYDRWKRDI